MLATDMRGLHRAAPPNRPPWRLLAAEHLAPHPMDRRRFTPAHISKSTAVCAGRFSYYGSGISPALSIVNEAIQATIAPRGDDKAAGGALALSGDFDVLLELAIELPAALANIGVAGTQYAAGVGINFDGFTNWVGLGITSSDGNGATEKGVTFTGATLDATTITSAPSFAVHRIDAMVFRIKRRGSTCQIYISSNGGLTWHPGDTASIAATALKATIFFFGTFNTGLSTSLRVQLLGMKFLNPRTALPE